MSFEKPQIDETKKAHYSKDCTGDVCVGDEIIFMRAVFIGTYPKSKFSHYETIEASVIKDSYGAQAQQHTFTLKLKDSEETMLIKGRNVYKNGTWRKPWADEKKRQVALDEKHDRGEAARAVRDRRKSKPKDDDFEFCEFNFPDEEYFQ